MYNAITESCGVFFFNASDNFDGDNLFQSWFHVLVNEQEDVFKYECYTYENYGK